MSASKEAILRAYRIAKYNEDIFGLGNAPEKTWSHVFMGFAAGPRKTRRNPNRLRGCRVVLSEDGSIV